MNKLFRKEKTKISCLRVKVMNYVKYEWVKRINVLISVPLNSFKICFKSRNLYKRSNGSVNSKEGIQIDKTRSSGRLMLTTLYLSQLNFSLQIILTELVVVETYLNCWLKTIGKLTLKCLDKTQSQMLCYEQLLTQTKVI